MLTTFLNNTTINTTLNVLFTPRGKRSAHRGVTRVLHGGNVGLGHGRVRGLISRVTTRVGNRMVSWVGGVGARLSYLRAVGTLGVSDDYLLDSEDSLCSEGGVPG